MSDLETRLQRMEDIDAIGKLKAAYCDACDDDHNGEAVAALFIPDGHWEYRGREPVTGSHAIAAHMFAIRESGAIRHCAHLLSNPAIEVEGDEATGRWRLVMMYTAADGQSFHRIIGRYEDRFIRHNGQWLFASLVVHVEERGPYQGESTL